MKFNIKYYFIFPPGNDRIFNLTHFTISYYFVKIPKFLANLTTIFIIQLSIKILKSGYHTINYFNIYYNHNILTKIGLHHVLLHNFYNYYNLQETNFLRNNFYSHQLTRNVVLSYSLQDEQPNLEHLKLRFYPK